MAVDFPKANGVQEQQGPMTVLAMQIEFPLPLFLCLVLES